MARALQPQLWRLLPALLGRRDSLLLGTLLLAAMATAVAVVFTVHDVRMAWADVHETQQARQRQLEERGRLLLERAAWSGYGRVERVARDDLGMVVPPATEIEVVTAAPLAATAGGAP